MNKHGSEVIRSDLEGGETEEVILRILKSLRKGGGDLRERKLKPDKFVEIKVFHFLHDNYTIFGSEFPTFIKRCKGYETI